MVLYIDIKIILLTFFSLPFSELSQKGLALDLVVPVTLALRLQSGFNI